MNLLFANIWGVISGDPRVRKSTVALGSTLVGGVGLALADGTASQTEITAAAGVAMVTAAAVWGFKNKA